MHLPSFLGLGAQRIINLDRHTIAVVTNVRTCWWLRVNTEPVRTAKNSRYPHIVHFTYSADGVQYSASRILNWQHNPPLAGQKFRLFYDPANPKRFAFPVF